MTKILKVYAEVSVELDDLGNAIEASMLAALIGERAMETAFDGIGKVIKVMAQLEPESEEKDRQGG
jgi:hypothetical protein